MVKWIGKFSLLLKRRRDAWMDMLPVSAMNQERRETQYLADVSQLNEERQKKCYCSGSEFARDQRPVARHTSDQPRKLFTFSDNLTTLFIVANDLSESLRERLTSHLALQ